MAGLRDWLRKASEPVVPAAPTPATVDGEVVKPIKGDDHYLRLMLEEIQEACATALKQEEPIEWWELSNTLAGLTDDLLEELEEEFVAGEV